MTFDLASLGWDAHFCSAYRPHDRPDQQPARVARVDRGVCGLLTGSGLGRASVGGALLTVAARDPVRLPTAGDWVVLRTWPDGRSTVEAVLARRTAIVRSTAGAEALGQTLASNVDSVAVVAPVDPEPDLGMVERLLCLAFESGAEPVVILTKVDLTADPELLVADVARVAPGVAVYGVSATEGTGLEPIRNLVGPGRTLGLIGGSGSGKSSLVNALAGATVMPTQPIRRVDGRGRHTTTHRALVPVHDGGSVVDTPGIRSVGLFVGAAGIRLAFADIEALAAACRFDDCGHTGEPGCAIASALATGDLGGRRLANWRKLRGEVDVEARRRQIRIARGRRRA